MLSYRSSCSWDFWEKMGHMEYYYMHTLDTEKPMLYGQLQVTFGSGLYTVTDTQMVLMAREKLIAKGYIQNKGGLCRQVVGEDR